MKAKVKKFYESDLLIAILIGSLIALIFVAIMFAMSQSVKAAEYPLLATSLQVSAPDLNAYGTDGNPADIQPAMGYAVFQGSWVNIQ